MLTNKVSGFILCVMNANEISPKTNARLKRIKIVCRIAKFVVLAIFSAFLWHLIYREAIRSFPTFHGLFYILSARVSIWTPTVRILDDFIIRPAIVVILSIWYLKLVGLFRFYEQGLIFADKTIRCLKILGLLCVVGWILNCISHHFSALEYQQLPPELLQGPTIIGHNIDFHGIGFFSFDFGTGIDFGLLLAGAVIVLVAWIMDEGRKIQEEQELTV